MKAIRKSDGKVIEVDTTPYFNMKTDEEYRRCLFDGKHYKLSELDFNVEDAEEVTIDGWVARNNEPCHGYDLHLFTSKPIRRQIMGDWYGYGETKLDTKPFPSLTWESEPLEVTITIKPKKI